MKTNPANTSLTRRDALKRAIQGALATAAIHSAVAAERDQKPTPAEASAFIPENDYPFFGGELPEGYRQLR